MSLLGLIRRCGIAAGVFGILAASLSGCGGGGAINSGSAGNSGGLDTSPGPGLTTPPDTNRAACQANAHVSGRARWTVLLYMNAANDLQPDSLLNVAQMASVGSDTNVNIVLQWKQAVCSTCGFPSFLGTRRYLIRKHTDADVAAIRNGVTTSLETDRLADPSTNDLTTHQSDMGDYHILHNFVVWGSQQYPADHLAVVVWDHGSGWRPALRSAAGPAASRRFRAVSQDSSTNNEIETTELPLAFMGAVQPIDALIVDASLEMMLEVAYEVRSSARVMIGSEESPPGAGYPYDKWLAALKASGKDPCDLGNSIVTTFVSNYASLTDVTQSVVDLSKMPAVAANLNLFGTSLLNHINDQAAIIAAARTNAQKYAFAENKDLYNFADLIRTTTTSADLRQAAFNLEASLRGTGAAIVYAGHGSTGQSGSYGLAIYGDTPQNYLMSYNELALTRNAPNWSRFLMNQRQ